MYKEEARNRFEELNQVVDQALTEIDAQQKEIQKMLALKALVNLQSQPTDEQDIEKLLENEFLNRESQMRQ